ncbi:MAG: hypothetical protein QM747_16435 [Nocardioides sp.]
MPPHVVVLVEGESDAAVVRVLCRSRGVPDAGLDLRDLGGVTNVGRELRRLAGDVRVLGLYDAPEERFVRRALQSTGRHTGDGSLLSHVGFWFCDPDLESELIRALGVRRVLGVLDELGELDRFHAFQRQPQWRGRETADQLHRFAGTASGRKLVLARRLAEELTPENVPTPLAELVAAIADATEVS